MATVDLYVGSGEDLAITNLTGHPTVVFPMGFRDRNGRDVPGSITLTGRLYDESTLLAVAVPFSRPPATTSSGPRSSVISPRARDFGVPSGWRWPSPVLEPRSATTAILTGPAHAQPC